MDDRVGSVHPHPQGLLVAEVALDELGTGETAYPPGIPHQRPHRVAARDEPPGHVPGDESRGPGDANLHASEPR
jgi:hypothetical protein